MRIAIVGGGIAGLAAAYELEKARQAGSDVEYVLYESRDRLGGSLASEIVNGAVLERGPDSFLTEKPAAAELCRELGIAADLVPSNDAQRKTCILVRNRLVPLPDGLMFLVPTKLIPTAFSRLFSIKTKFRMAIELLLPPRPSAEDESVAALVERHFGQEAVDRLADPLLSGIYGGDAVQLSANTVLPRMVEMETRYGSLTRGMLVAHHKMRQAMRKARSNGARPNANPGARAIFTAVRGGMQQLVGALESHIDKRSIRLSTPVSGVARTPGGWQVESPAGSEHFSALILASPAWASAVLLTNVDPELADDLGGIPYSSSITINLVYDATQLGRLPDGFGFLVPACECRSMLACTFVHRKFRGRAPEGKVVLRAFLGGSRNEFLLAESDEALVDNVRRELTEILGEKVLPSAAVPEHTQISRWRRAMAQYAVGHKQRKLRIDAHVAALPGLKLAGNAYDGIGIPDCIRLGRQAARELAGIASSPIPQRIS